MDLLHFKERLSETLILVNNIVVRKRGRPRCSPVSSLPSLSSTPKKPKKIIKRIDQRPFDEVKYDYVGHLPHYDKLDNAIRCKYNG